MEAALLMCQEALQIYTLAQYPYRYASLQATLGNVYREALHIWTLDAMPQDYAMAQRNLGETYQKRIQGDRQENLNLTLASHQEALHTGLVVNASCHGVVPHNE